MAHTATVVHAAARDQPAVATLIADDFHADLVVVLASMVMTTHEERWA
jgi:hypothetical protein